MSKTIGVASWMQDESLHGTADKESCHSRLLSGDMCRYYQEIPVKGKEQPVSVCGILVYMWLIKQIKEGNFDYLRKLKAAKYLFDGEYTEPNSDVVPEDAYDCGRQSKYPDGVEMGLTESIITIIV